VDWSCAIESVPFAFKHDIVLAAIKAWPGGGGVEERAARRPSL